MAFVTSVPVVTAKATIKGEGSKHPNTTRSGFAAEVLVRKGKGVKRSEPGPTLRFRSDSNFRAAYTIILTLPSPRSLVIELCGVISPASAETKQASQRPVPLRTPARPFIHGYLSLVPNGSSLILFGSWALASHLLLLGGNCALRSNDSIFNLNCLEHSIAQPRGCNKRPAIGVDGRPSALAASPRRAITAAPNTPSMCLIRVRREIDDEEVVHPRPANTATTTTVITPIPPAPPPPPSNALVTTTNSGYAYDVGTNTLIETDYSRDNYARDGYAYEDRHGRRRSSDSDYIYDSHRSESRRRRHYSDQPITTTKTTIIKGAVGRSYSDSRSRSRSRSRVYTAAGLSASGPPNIVIGPEGSAYVKTHRHRHRRRSGSLEREKSVTRYTHAGSLSASAVVTGGRRSNVSISRGRMSSVEMSEPRSSFRYIEPRGPAARGLESAEMVRRRESERFAYGGMSEHRRSGSISYVHADSGHRRSFSGGAGRRSRDKVMVVDQEYY
ncbi:hypothetical protein BDZ91DRAFT_760604 [Kalaharituber pfeilii]|nr:hypothetical protein BDZ91DRAFT_760604 [Kalaharituber pfeilii]